MSLNVLGAISLAAEGGEGEGFHAPEPSEFYQPLIGSGDWAFTRMAMRCSLTTMGRENESS